MERCSDTPAGDDPLSDSECDLDSVAGVLKLYFRGLEPPLFPYDSYSQLLECVRKTPPPKMTLLSVCLFRIMQRFLLSVICCIIWSLFGVFLVQQVPVLTQQNVGRIDHT